MENHILKWPISAGVLSGNEIRSAKRKREVWESPNCALAKRRGLLETWDVALHLGVLSSYVISTFPPSEWHHSNRERMYFYNSQVILEILAQNEPLRLHIRNLAEKKYPNILIDSSVLTGWEKRIYSRNGYKRYNTAGKFVIWKDIANSGSGMPNREQQEARDEELREKIRQRSLQ